jgi:hypothetical protein
MIRNAGGQWGHLNPEMDRKYESLLQVSFQASLTQRRLPPVFPRSSAKWIEKIRASSDLFAQALAWRPTQRRLLEIFSIIK